MGVLLICIFGVLRENVLPSCLTTCLLKRYIMVLRNVEHRRPKKKNKDKSQQLLLRIFYCLMPHTNISFLFTVRCDYDGAAMVKGALFFFNRTNFMYVNEETEIRQVTSPPRGSPIRGSAPRPSHYSEAYKKQL